MTNDRRPTTNDQRPMTDERWPTTNDLWPRTEDRGLTTNDQWLRTNDRRPMTDDQRPTTNDQRPATAEELKYSRYMARRRWCPTNNMFKVWQNLAPFGGRPIGSAVEALLTKVVNRQYWRSPIVVFFVAAAVSITLRVSYSQRRSLKVWYTQRHLCNHNPLAHRPLTPPWSHLLYFSSSASEEQNFDLAKLIFIRVRYVHADPINFIS